MLSLFRTPVSSHIQCGYRQWPYIPLHLKENKQEWQNQIPRALAKHQQWSSRSPHCCQTLTSSQTSRTAATLGSSSGSMPPPGTIHRSGWRLLLTSSTCREESTADGQTQSNAPSQSPAEQKLSLYLSHLQTQPTQHEPLKILQFFQDNFLSPFQAAVQTTLSVTPRHSNTPNDFSHYLLAAPTLHRINYASAYQNNDLLFDTAWQYLYCKSSLLYFKVTTWSCQPGISIMQQHNMA